MTNSQWQILNLQPTVTPRSLSGLKIGNPKLVIGYQDSFSTRLRCARRSPALVVTASAPVLRGQPGRNLGHPPSRKALWRDKSAVVLRTMARGVRLRRGLQRAYGGRDCGQRGGREGGRGVEIRAVAVSCSKFNGGYSGRRAGSGHRE